MEDSKELRLQAVRSAIDLERNKGQSASAEDIVKSAKTIHEFLAKTGDE